MTEFRDLSVITSLFTGVTVFFTTRSLLTTGHVPTTTSNPFPASSITLALTTDGPFTGVDVETITSTFTSTLIFTGVSLETHTVSPTARFSSSGETGTVKSTQQPAHAMDATPPPPPTPVVSTITSQSPASPTTPAQISSGSAIPWTQTAIQTISTSDHSTSSDTANRGGSDKNRNLARILPAVLLPLAFVIVLVYVVLRRYRRNPRWDRLPPVPFISPVTSTASLSRGTGGNLFTGAGKAGMRHVQVAREPTSSPTIAVANQGRPTGTEPNGTSDPAEQGNQAVGYQPVPPGMTMPEPIVVPEIQAEILDIRARLADIESREPLAPPPQYSSEC